MARYLPLPGGNLAIVDDADYDKVKMFKWSTNGSGYVFRKMGKIKKHFYGFDIGKDVFCKDAGKHILLHRFLMGAIPDGMVIDHINGNPIDNRRENLRICTNSQNTINSKCSKASRSGYKGVGWDKKVNKWRAVCNKKLVGYYDSDETAALAYNEFAVKEFGEYARLNTIDR